MWRYGLDRAGSRQGQLADTCDCGNEPSGSIKCGEFRDQLKTCQLLKKDSAPWCNSISKVSACFTKCFIEMVNTRLKSGTRSQNIQSCSHRWVRTSYFIPGVYFSRRTVCQSGHLYYIANGGPVRSGAPSPAKSTVGRVGGRGVLSLRLVLGCYFSSLVATCSDSRLNLKSVLVVTRTLS